MANRRASRYPPPPRSSGSPFDPRRNTRYGDLGSNEYYERPVYSRSNYYDSRRRAPNEATKRRRDVDLSRQDIKRHCNNSSDGVSNENVFPAKPPPTLDSRSRTGVPTKTKPTIPIEKPQSAGAAPGSVAEILGFNESSQKMSLLELMKRRIEALEKENSILATNISTLYVTARDELARKDNTIMRQEEEIRQLREHADRRV